MKLAVVYGTRPEFLKLKLLIQRLCPVVIRVKQHEDYTDDEGFPHHIIDIDKGDYRLSCIGASILRELPKYIQTCSHVMVQGDTATCFYSMVCAQQLKKKCIHLEAGMRTYDINNPWPEESYRQMISRITDIHFCPSINEAHCLGSEKTRGEIHIVGNTILDLVKSYNIPITQEKRVLITLHRRENWENYKLLVQKIDKLASEHPDYEFIFLIHPNPILKNIVREHGTHMNVREPVSHRQLIEILASCTCVITDSGGIQEEANFLGKHIYVLRECTERTLIPRSKCTINPETISLDVQQYEQGYEYGNGGAVDKIIRKLILSYRERCCICDDGSKLVDVFSMPKFPITYSPPTHNFEDDVFVDLVYGACETCGSVQLKTLIDQDILYKSPHNETRYSKKWNDHHQAFSEFISVHNRPVIEIGGASGNLARIISNRMSSYTIMDMSEQQYDKVSFIQGNCETYTFSKNDVLVMSHVFEHLYEPRRFIKNCSKNQVCDIFISVPFMNVDSDMIQIQIEHTFFLDETDMERMFLKHNYRLVKKKNFIDHSIFFHFCYDHEIKNTTFLLYPERSLKIINALTKHKTRLENISLSPDTWVSPGGLYGQYVYYYSKCKIKGFLDNDPNKQYKRVYGTPYMVHPPFKSVSNVFVYGGPYTKEIETFFQTNK